MVNQEQMGKIGKICMAIIGALDIITGLFNLITGKGSIWLALYYVLLVALGILFIKHSLKKTT
jgi:uncharacterized membrane protein HdeD (DUF308 family)